MASDHHPAPHSQSPVSFRHLFIALTDIIGAIILVLWGIVLGPLGVLRGTLLLGNFFWYVWVLSPQGLLSRLVKAAIDWRLGNFDAAVFQMEFLVSRVEKYLLLHPRYRHAHFVLEDFYTLLVRAYLHGGHIDDAMMVVLRAKKSLGSDRLPALARLDAKTAHLVRAGLAAGKLLDGGGLATLFVKSNAEVPRSSENSPPSHPSPPRTPGNAGTTSARQGASAQIPVQRQGPTKMGQLIPFPSSPRKPAAPEKS